MRRITVETLQRMAREFYEVQLSEDQLARLKARLEGWLRDLDAVEDKMLEPEEPITVVYVWGKADAGQRG